MLRLNIHSLEKKEYFKTSRRSPKFITFSTIFLFGLQLYAQGDPITLQESYFPVVPHSPTVTSLTKFQETPVSKNSGLPDIQIPIYTIQLDDLQIPIYLSYHSGGIRVNETASWAGQNWNLIAGGNITRIVNHLSDDYPSHGFINTPITTEEIWDACMGGNEYDCIEYMHTRIREKTLDCEPDVFSYSAPGISGKFMFNQVRDVSAYGEIKTIPVSKNKITHFGHSPITGWEIKDIQGNTYLFEIGNELMETEAHTVESIGNLPQHYPFQPNVSNYTQTWNLSKITTSTGKEVNFTYDLMGSGNYTYHDCTFSEQSNSWLLINGQENNLKTTYIESKGKTRYLSGITGDFGSIVFDVSGSEREDYPNGKSLDDIEIRDKNGNLIKKYDLSYFYTFNQDYPDHNIWGCGGAINQQKLYDTEDPTKYNPYMKRMFLDKIIVSGVSGSESFDYSFDYYNDEILPHRNSYAQDFWGYYNGATDNNTFMFNYLDDYMEDPNRHISETFGKAGLLKRIYYPEGGFTEYEYESNKGIITMAPYSHRLVPSEAKNIYYFAQEPHEYIPNNGGMEVFIFKKILLLNHSTFPLTSTPADGRVGEFKYYISLAQDTSEQTQGICIPPEGSLPTEYDCSFWLNLRKTYLNPADYTSPEDISLEDIVNYDDSFPQFTKLATYDPKHATLPVGVYVAEFHIRNPTGGFPMGDIFDIVNDLAGFNIDYRVAKNDNDGIREFDDVFFYEDYTKFEIPIGGQRIKKISDFQKEGELSKTRTYKYELDSTGKSSGRTLSVPYFISKVNNEEFRESSVSAVPLVTTNPGNLNYTRVLENFDNLANPSESFSMISTYSFHELPFFYSNPMFPFIEDWRYGQDLSEEVPLKYKKEKGFSTNFVPIIETDPSSFTFGVLSPTTAFPYMQTIDGTDAWTLGFGGGGGWSGETFYKLQYGHPSLNFESEKIYYDDDPNKVVSTSTSYDYENDYNHQPTRIERTTSEGDETIVTKIYYPHDLVGTEPNMNGLIASDRIGVPIKKETFKNNGTSETMLSTQTTKFSDFNGEILPSKIQIGKGNGELEDRVSYNNYNDKGNPTDVSLVNGIRTSYIWGYNGQHIVAKIDNKAYVSLPQTLLTEIESSTSEATLLTKLTQLRNHPSLADAMVTTYTYIPLVGVSTVTEPNGNKMTYVYDNLGRLEYVQDQDGNILGKNEYHYKND